MESAIRHRRALSGPRRIGRRGLVLPFGLLVFGCSALNPAAVQVLFPRQVADDLVSGTLENAPGHVAIVFINNTRFSGPTLEYLRSRGIDVDSDPNLRPRVRFRVGVEFVGGSVNTFEFIDGSDVIDTPLVTVAPEGGEEEVTAAVPPPDLTESTLTNTVVVCDVGLVAPAVVPSETNSSIEVFVPTFLKEITITEVVLGFLRRELADTIPPRFWPLLVDSVDDGGTITVTRNFGTRDVPGFPTNLTCGSVVTFVLSGDLSLPFVVDENNASVPGFLDTQVNRQAAIPGRFELVVSVR